MVTVENVSPLLDHDNAVYVFMGAGDIQLYERSFEELLARLQTHMLYIKGSSDFARLFLLDRKES